jgi:hypothetical protein
MHTVKTALNEVTTMKTASGEVVRFETSINPWGWHFVSFPDGARLTKDMIDFDVKREDVQVNVYGVVLFREQQVAEALLGLNDFMADHIGRKRFDRPASSQVRSQSQKAIGDQRV